MRVLNKENTFMMLDFFANLIHPLVDTYLIVLTTLELICGRNLVLKNKKLIKELHVTIKRLYQLRIIPALQSSLKEVIETAIERFEQMGFIEIRAYMTKKGSTTLFLQCAAESKPKIHDLWKKLRLHRSTTREQENTVYAQVEETILRTQGPLQMARL